MAAAKIKPMFRLEKPHAFATDAEGARMLVMRPANDVIARAKIVIGSKE